MVARTLALTSLLVATALGIAIAHERSPAQGVATQSANQPRTFQLHVLPGETGQWLVLDTRSGDVQHWARQRNDYTVTTLRRNKVPGQAWERVVLRPPSDTGR